MNRALKQLEEELPSPRADGNITSAFDIDRAIKVMETGNFADAERQFIGLSHRFPGWAEPVNRRATILDGQRVTYITRYSSFTNLFATDSMDAGLRLSVLPSLGESGYLTLDLRAELTSLGASLSGSPTKDGQIVENTVVVKDGDTVLLGGFTRTNEQHSTRRFPLLGRVLPFLFSRDMVTRTTRQNFILITPHVVDLTGGVDPRIKDVIEHQ